LELTTERGEATPRQRQNRDVDTAYRIEIEASPRRIRVSFHGVVIADSTSALIMRETRHAPVYYLPRKDVRMDFLHRTAHRTHCPFRGNASYWTIKVGEHAAENAAWSYEDPLPEAAEIKDHVAFYWNQVEFCHEGDEAPPVAPGEATAQSGNRLFEWLLREAWQAGNVDELVTGLARALIANGLPLMRLSLVLRTLHPQLAGSAFLWYRDKEAIEVRRLAHASLQSPTYLNSPMAPIFNGAGGIRRRLEGDNPQLDFPILEDLHAAGATDYVAMPMLFSDGQINALTLVADAPGGFTTDQLGQIYEALPLIARLAEVHAVREMARVLLDTYLGAHSGRRVLEGRIKRGDGDSIPAVIWMCDLRGSTAMADSMPRESYLNLLNEFFETTAGAVLDQGGEVLKFIGDAVLAIFPIDEAHGPAKQSCRRALDAARHCQTGIETLNQERAARGAPPLRFALAMHLGEVTYGNVGTPGRLDFTVIGPATNETARLAGLSKELGRDVLISESFAGQFRNELVPLGRHCLRGVGATQEIFTLPPETPSATPPA